MLARLQQALTLALIAAALCWAVFWWPRAPHVSLLGLLAPVAGYASILACEFVALRFLAPADPVPPPSAHALVRAWLRELSLGPRVFCWRQPFRSHLVGDDIPEASAVPRRGVVLIHGFVCNRGFWNPWLLRLRAANRPFIAVSLEPVFGSIDEYVAIIDEAVRRLTSATGLAPDLLCHSMGGLAARAWLVRPHPGLAVDHVVTIASPHRGTWLGRFGGFANGKQMHLGSAWLRALEYGCTDAAHASFTCWYSDCDNIVFPVSTATLPGADNRLVRGAAHVDLAFHPEVMEKTLALLSRA